MDLGEYEIILQNGNDLMYPDIYHSSVFDFGHVPETVVEVVVVLDPDPLVFLLDVLGRHQGLPHRQGVRLPFGEDSDDGA